MPSRKTNNITLPFGSESELKKYLEGTVTNSLHQLIRVTVNLMVKEEMQQFRESMKGEFGAMYFNGSYPRDMKAPLGMVRDVPIPRFRDNSLGYTPTSLSVFSEQEEQFMKLVSEMHRLGVSQRKVAGIAKTSVSGSPSQPTEWDACTGNWQKKKRRLLTPAHSLTSMSTFISMVYS